MGVVFTWSIFIISLTLTLQVSIVFGNYNPFHPTPPPSTTTPEDYYEDVNSKSKKSEIFDKIFEGSGYDTKLRPPGLNGTGPTVINISLHIRAIENIDDVRMQYAVQLTFRQEWLDSRLKYSHIRANIKYLQLVRAERIWSPDIFFSNEKDGKLHQLIVPNLFTRIYENGAVLQSYRVTLLLSCPMDLRSYPLDTQRCPVQMASYGWTTQDILLKWRGKAAVQMARDFQMPRFKMKEHVISECASVTSTGDYSCVKLEIEFEREFGFYLIQIYVPCSLLCLVSSVTFWLEPTAVEARVSLGVTTILAIVTQTYGINQSAPPASYVKAMDVWTAFCQAMVFGALLEFALVNYLSRVVGGGAKSKDSLSPFEEGGEGGKAMKAFITEKAIERAKGVDMTARVAFPLMFLLFNILYWGHYLKYFSLFNTLQPAGTK